MTSAYSSLGAWGVGLATVTANGEGAGQILDVWFPQGRLGLGAPPWADSSGDREGTGRLTDADAAEAFGMDLTSSLGRDAVRGVEVVAVSVAIASLADPPTDAADAYLRLHLLSHRFVAPHGANLDGIFGALANVAWTDRGPVAADRVEEVRLIARAAGHRLTVYGVDKFPRMVDYVVPSGVRIADADRVRLGAHLAAGTTVMHEGFVNFNAGTLGSSMVEGRISAGVVIGDGSDVGGGSSIMGTLSGGGKETIRIGERCLVGANAGCGISLGDDCVIEAGCYVTAGSKVTLPDGTTVKARDLSGQPGLLFWRNSVTGTLEVKPREGKASWGGLNAALHANT